MNHDEAQLRMQEIQRIMERATLWTLLPGTAAIVGGVMVLIGCGVSYAMFRSLDFADILKTSMTVQSAFCLMWFTIGVVGVGQEISFTSSAAKRLGMPISGRSTRLALFSMTPSVVVAMVLTVKFLSPNFPRPEEIRYIVPVWMMLYGTGVYTAGLFSIRPPRVLGLVFILMGVVALFAYSDYGIVWAALSFGLLHILFGIYVIRKQKQANPS